MFWRGILHAVGFCIFYWVWVEFDVWRPILSSRAFSIQKIACSCIFSAMCCRHNSPWDGKSPNSIAAAIIYMVTQLPAATNKPSTTTIALECSIAEGTLQSTYRDLYTEKAALIPKWFAKTEDLQQLQQPREKYWRVAKPWCASTSISRKHQLLVITVNNSLHMETLCPCVLL